MKYKGWLILTIILGFFWMPLGLPLIWVLSVVIAVLGIYSDKKKRVVKSRVVRRKVTKKKKPKKKKR